MKDKFIKYSTNYCNYIIIIASILYNVYNYYDIKIIHLDLNIITSSSWLVE